MNTIIQKFVRQIADTRIFNPRGSLGTPARLEGYLEHIFSGIDIKDKIVLDVGAGYGVYSLYMALMGAKKVISLEPELEGGTNKMIAQFDLFRSSYGLKNIEIRKELFQQYHPDVQKFDIILLHNSINHLNENACMTLTSQSNSKQEYLKYFDTFFNWQQPGGFLVVADCSSRNFFGDCGLKSPLAPSIEWNKHQPPQVWKSLAEEANYQLKSLRWTTTGYLGDAERLIFSNRLAAYFMLSHFVLTLKK